MEADTERFPGREELEGSWRRETSLQGSSMGRREEIRKWQRREEGGREGEVGREERRTARREGGSNTAAGTVGGEPGTAHMACSAV